MLNCSDELDSELSELMENFSEELLELPLDSLCELSELKLLSEIPSDDELDSDCELLD